MHKTKLYKTNEYLDMVKNKLISNGLSGSDYNIAKTLDIAQSAMSRYRNHRGTMDDKTCVKVADYLRIDPMEVIASANAERAQTKDDEKFWTGVVKRLSATAAAVLLATSLPHVSDDLSAQTMQARNSAEHCILC